MSNSDLTPIGRLIVRLPKPVRWLLYMVVISFGGLLELIVRTPNFLHKVWKDVMWAVRYLEKEATREGE